MCIACHISVSAGIPELIIRANGPFANGVIFLGRNCSFLTRGVRETIANCEIMMEIMQMPRGGGA